MFINHLIFSNEENYKVKEKLITKIFGANFE